MSHSLETLFRIYDDRSGDYLEIGPDHDGLDLVEIRSYHASDPHTVQQRTIIVPEALPLVIEALTHFLKNKDLH